MLSWMSFGRRVRYSVISHAVLCYAAVVQVRVNQQCIQSWQHFSYNKASRMNLTVWVWLMLVYRATQGINCCLFWTCAGVNISTGKGRFYNKNLQVGFRPKTTLHFWKVAGHVDPMERSCKAIYFIQFYIFYMLHGSYQFPLCRFCFYLFIYLIFIYLHFFFTTKRYEIHRSVKTNETKCISNFQLSNIKYSTLPV